MFKKTRRDDDDFDEEIRAHIEIEADRLEEEGMRRDEALAAARRTFGNVTGHRETFYETSRWMWLDLLARDVRYAFRQMRRTPVVTATIVLSLAVGIGATTAVFSIGDQTLMRALPVAEPSRLVQLDWNGLFIVSGMGSVGSGSLIPYPLYRELRADNDVFADMFARSPEEVHLTVGSTSEPATVEVVTGSYFPTLGVRPALGRLLDDSDDLRPDAHPVVVLSYETWRARFGADPNVLGRQVRINDYPMTVVGVADQSFRGMDWGNTPALWVPLMMKARVTPGWSGLEARRTRFLHVFGRLKPGVTREQAQTRLGPWFAAYLRADTEREGWPGATDEQMRQYLGTTLDLLPAAQGPSEARRHIERPVLILLAASALILLLACFNVANLSLASALGRRRATAMRVALGATRRRVACERLVESAMLATVGCGIGVLLAPLLGRALIAFMPTQGAGAVALSAGLDWRVLAFTLAVAAATTLLCGLAPALFMASVKPLEVLKRNSTSVAGGLGLRKAFVVGQFALALVLLVGAGLFARTLATLRAQGPGYSTTNLVTFRVDPPSDGRSEDESKREIRRLLDEVRALPDVERAGVGRWEMLSGGGWGNPVTVAGSGRRVVTDNTSMNAVSPGYFEALGVPVSQGRDFDARDARDDSEWAIRSAIVNEEFVRRYLDGVEPVGARVGMGDAPGAETRIEIVGVVHSFQDHGLRDPEPEVFFPLWERSVEAGTYYVRTRGASSDAGASIRAAAGRIDPGLTVLALRSVDDQLDRVLTTERMLTTLAIGFAAVATLLATIGLYSVLSFSAASRSKEIGIRLALGATRRGVGSLIVREALVLTGAGLVIALPLAWALGRAVESQLFGVRPFDVATVVGAGAILAFVCLAASAVPARKVGTVDPLEALKSD